MLKKRIIGVLVVKNKKVVQSIGFKKYLPVGSVEVSIEYLDRWGIDEIVVLDIDATKEKREPDYKLIQKISSIIQTPLSIGGGITTLTQMEALVKGGADKVVINSSFLSTPQLLKEGALHFGRQCMIVSLDAIKTSNGYKVKHNNLTKINEDVVYQAMLAEEIGAGEIFLNSVDNDGMKQGYDLELLKKVKAKVNIPIILCGGVGTVHHLIEGANAGADAVAAGNFFHFTEMSVVAVKSFMKAKNLDVRLETYANYNNLSFDPENGRTLRLTEAEYEKMRFEYIPEEKI